jgi:predicted dehydrogenase
VNGSPERSGQSLSSTDNHAGVGVGVIGLGFMGQTHVRGYRAAGATLLAVLDSSPQRRTGMCRAEGNLGDASDEQLFDPAKVNATDDLASFFQTPDLQLVSICTPTLTHVDLACQALRAGKHVLVEKPVALSLEAVRTLRDCARDTNRMCMPAMCMRYWPAWAWVKQAIDLATFGKVTAMRLERTGARPGWGNGFYSDESRCGGALFDLHVHDTDYITHCMGVPSEVMSVGDTSHMTTLYRYTGPDAPQNIVARGGWLNSSVTPFTMRLQVEFERAVADFELGRAHELAVYTHDGQTLYPQLESFLGWEGQIRAIVSAVAKGLTVPPTTMDDAVAVTAVLEAERESLRTGRTVRVIPSGETA